MPGTLTDDMAKRGRPPKPKAERLSAQYGIRFTEADAKLVEKAAKLAGQDAVDWVREIAVQQAREHIKRNSRG